MTEIQYTEIQYIDRQDAWEQAASALSAQPILALDTESNSRHAYRERLCLIQIAHPGGVIILDPIAVPDLASLGRLLACPGTLKTLHGASYDLTCLYRQHQFRLENLFDTEIAARFLGLTNTRLAAVLQTCLQLSIPKSPALQRSDWSRRPLSPNALAYAAADVAHLPRLTALLRARLQQLNRLDWVAEECQRMTRAPTQPPPAPAEPAFLRTKGAHRLTPRQLAILRELWNFREAEAQRRNLPPFKVLNPQILLRLAQSPHPAAPSPEATPAMPPRYASEIAAAIARGWSASEYRRPPDAGRKPSPTPEAAARLRGLKNWRENRAAAFKIDPSLIWPTRSLERIAAAPPQPGCPPDHDSPEVRRWQRQEFGPQLNALCASRQWRQGQTVAPPPSPASQLKPAPVD